MFEGVLPPDNDAYNQDFQDNNQYFIEVLDDGEFNPEIIEPKDDFFYDFDNFDNDFDNFDNDFDEQSTNTIPEENVNADNIIIHEWDQNIELKCHFNTITVVNSISFNNFGADEEDDEEFHDEYDPEDNSSSSCKQNQILNYYEATPLHFPLNFMCRSNEEKEKWKQCLRGVIEPNFLNNRRDENALQLWILEAKGQAISSKPNKKYFCQVFLNNALHARTCCNFKKDILFWRENFDFKYKKNCFFFNNFSKILLNFFSKFSSNIQCDNLRVEIYQETVETHKKKIAKQKKIISIKKKSRIFTKIMPILILLIKFSLVRF